MKIPAGGSSNGYYGHDSPVISYASENGSDGSSNGQEVDSPTLDGDFSEYMWMENEEEFDKQVMQQLEEEALMEQCIEAMLEDERETRIDTNQVRTSNGVTPAVRQPWSSAGDYGAPSASNSSDLCQTMENLRVRDNLAKESTLNPNAAEFVPIRMPVLAATPVPS